MLKRILLTVALCSLGAAMSAQTAAQKGTQIAEQADGSGAGYGDVVVSGEMTLRSGGGGTSTRKFETRTIEVKAGQSSRSMLVFDWPGDIRGTALLTHSFETKKDAQWLFLPAVGWSKR